LTQREYTDRDGATRQSLDVRAREMRMLDKAGERGDVSGGSGDFGGSSSAPPSRPASAPSSGFNDGDTMDDIPF